MEDNKDSGFVEDITKGWWWTDNFIPHHPLI